jgi:hypothetical protein
VRALAIRADALESRPCRRVLRHPRCGLPEIRPGRKFGTERACVSPRWVSVACIFQNGAYRPCFARESTFGQMPASFTRFGTNHTLALYADETFDLGVPPTTRTRPHSAARPPRSSDLARLLDLPQPRRLDFPLALRSVTTLAGFQPKSLAPSRSRSSTRSPRWFAMPTEWVGRKHTTT